MIKHIQVMMKLICQHFEVKTMDKTYNYKITLNKEMKQPTEIVYDGNTYVLKDENSSAICNDGKYKKDVLECLIYNEDEPLNSRREKGDISILINGEYVGSIFVSESGKVQVILSKDEGCWVTKENDVDEYDEITYYPGADW